MIKSVPTNGIDSTKNKIIESNTVKSNQIDSKLTEWVESGKSIESKIMESISK